MDGFNEYRHANWYATHGREMAALQDLAAAVEAQHGKLVRIVVSAPIGGIGVMKLPQGEVEIVVQWPCGCEPKAGGGYARRCKKHGVR